MCAQNTKETAFYCREFGIDAIPSVFHFYQTNLISFFSDSILKIEHFYFFCRAIFCIWILKCEIVDLVMLNDINSLLYLTKYGSNNGGRYQSWPKIEFPINHFYLIDFIDDISTDFAILPKRQYSR